MESSFGKEMIGRIVQDRKGKEVGTLVDFVIDISNGEIFRPRHCLWKQLGCKPCFLSLEGWKCVHPFNGCILIWASYFAENLMMHG